MGDVIRQQRHFLNLFIHTTPLQRKALLQTLTNPQMKAFSEIAHNIVKGIVPLSPKDQLQFKRERRLLHLLGSKALGIVHKKNLVKSKQRILHHLVTVAVTYLKSVLQ